MSNLGITLALAVTLVCGNSTTVPFVKIHDTILDSSVWAEGHATRIVWITMLAMADADGVVAASVGGLARRAIVSKAECEAALRIFLSPDSDSRDGTDGTRIEKVPGGWLVLNHAQYRDRRTEAQIKTAERVRRHRARKKAKGVSHNVTLPRNDLSPSEAEAEAEAEAEKTKKAASGQGFRIKASEREAAGRVLDHLSLRVGELNSRARGYGPTDSNLREIVRRLRDGVSEDELRDVINARAAECRSRPESLKWLNPATPFRDANWPVSQSLANEWRQRGGKPVTQSGYMQPDPDAEYQDGKVDLDKMMGAK